MSNEIVDMDQLLKIVQNTAMNVSVQSEQMGLVLGAVNDMKQDLNKVKGELGGVVEDVRGLKEDQFVDLICADNIRISAQNKVAQLLNIEFDERGGVTEESMYVYKKYFGKFVGRLHVDARHAGLEGPRIYATPRKNYHALIDFINEWVPKRGVEGLKSYYDGLEVARKGKESKRVRRHA